MNEKQLDFDNRVVNEIEIGNISSGHIGLKIQETGKYSMPVLHILVSICSKFVRLVGKF
jgi:hypothetical protein